MSTTPTLRAGAKGAAVLAAQTRLRMHGAKIEADSSFGPATMVYRAGRKGGVKWKRF